MGFNNAGAAALAAASAAAGAVGVPVGISLGKSKVTPLRRRGRRLPDLVASRAPPRRLHRGQRVLARTPRACAALQDRGPLAELLGALTAEAGSLALAGPAAGRPVPVLVKIAPDLTDDAIAEVLQVCADRGIAGVIAANTTLSRAGLAAADDTRWPPRAGGLSGRPLRAGRWRWSGSSRATPTCR